MIEARFGNLVFDKGICLPEDGPVLIEVSGHAGCGVKGTDIVCAAASVLTHTLLVSVHRSTGSVREFKDSEGNLSVTFDCPGRNDPGRETLRSMIEFFFTGMAELASQYPDNVRLYYNNEKSALMR